MEGNLTRSRLWDYHLNFPRYAMITEVIGNPPLKAQSARILKPSQPQLALRPVVRAAETRGTRAVEQ